MISSHNPANLVEEFRAVLLEGAEEVLGLDEARGLFEQAQARVKHEAELGLHRELYHFHEMLENEYGQPAAQGLAQRMGRAGFRKGLKRWGNETGLLEPSFRLLPLTKRILTGLTRMAEVLGKKTGLAVQVGRTDGQWTMRFGRGPQSVAPPCHLIVGTLQEFMSWASCGRVYQVRVVECAAYGVEHCLFTIDMKPLD
ncbi:MAG: hypothetical protein JW987_03350 [Anaerolineaceae bacterium]|nr:hypothetical protein [Anaerolineaceae bacterium]